MSFSVKRSFIKKIYKNARNTIYTDAVPIFFTYLRVVALLQIERAIQELALFSQSAIIRPCLLLFLSEWCLNHFIFFYTFSTWCSDFPSRTLGYLQTIITGAKGAHLISVLPILLLVCSRKNQVNRAVRFLDLMRPKLAD